jgi:hypothetical protein
MNERPSPKTSLFEVCHPKRRGVLSTRAFRPFGHFNVKSDTERFGNVYSGPAVLTGRTVDPTCLVDLSDRENISFGAWVGYCTGLSCSSGCESNGFFATVAT